MTDNDRFAVLYNSQLLFSVSLADVKENLKGFPVTDKYRRPYAVTVDEVDDDDDDDDVGLNVLGCRADILGTNCNKLLKLKINGGGRRGGRFSFSTCTHVSQL